MNGSVVRLISFCRGKNSFSNSSGSHGTVVYRDFSVWESTSCVVAPVWGVRRGRGTEPRALVARVSSSCAGEERVACPMLRFGSGVVVSVAVDAECVSGTCSGHASSRRWLDAHREELVHIFEQPTLGRLGLVRRRLQERSWTGRALVLHGRGGLPTLGGGEKPVYCTPQLPVFGDLRRRPQGLANETAEASELRETTHPWCRAESGLSMSLQGTLPSCAAPEAGRSCNRPCQCSQRCMRILDVDAMAKVRLGMK